MPQEDVTQPGPLKGGRQRANHIQVHRLEFGLKEREYVESLQAGALLTMGAVGLSALAAAAGLALAGFGAYWASKKAWGWGQEAVDEIDQWMGDVTVREAIVGRAKYEDPTTGVTHNNPFAGVPLLGSLFGTGINIGIASWRAANK